MNNEWMDGGERNKLLELKITISSPFPGVWLGVWKVDYCVMLGMV